MGWTGAGGAVGRPRISHFLFVWSVPGSVLHALQTLVLVSLTAPPMEQRSSSPDREDMFAGTAKEHEGPHTRPATLRGHFL